MHIIYCIYTQNHIMLAYTSTRKYVIELNIPSDSLTNLERNNVADKRYAVYRCNKAKVINIYDKYSKHRIISAQSDSGIPITYKIGKVIIIKNYDTDINKVFASGIYFYLSEECAVYSLINWYDSRNIVQQQQQQQWYENGIMRLKFSIKLGKPTGKCETWYNDGTRKEKSWYMDGFRTGKFEYWYETGQRCIKCYYVNDKCEGEYNSWYDDGTQYIKCYFDNGNILQPPTTKRLSVSKSTSLCFLICAFIFFVFITL
jgi:antitoxin component YwqK of YwqJK toxin-antitoxin module